MRVPKSLTAFIYVLTSIFLAQTAHAQWTFNPNLVGNVMSPVNLNPCTGGACEGGADSAASDANNQAMANAFSATDPALSFQISRANRDQNLARFIEEAKKVDPAGAADMERLFASTDVIGQIGQGIAPYGLRTDNVADAYAVYWMTAWQAVTGDTSDFTQQQSEAVKQQAANALLSTPTFVNATDALKQEMAEAYLIQAALIQATVDVAQTDQGLQAGLSQAVSQGAKASGLDLDAIVLTQNGFRLR